MCRLAHPSGNISTCLNFEALLLLWVWDTVMSLRFSSYMILANFSSSLNRYILVPFAQFIVCHVNPFWTNLFYLNLISLLGFFSLKITKPRANPPHDLDLFFTSVSALTLSSMSTIEMEVFSNLQLIILVVIMLLGNEVFISVFTLLYRASRLRKSSPDNSILQTKNLSATRCLSYTVLGYLLVVHVVGCCLVYFYMIAVPSANQVLKHKGIQLSAFTIFTIVSSFTNCGFIPTNENMISFKGNSGLLLILIPQILMGNTLYPLCLRSSIWALWKLTGKPEFSHILDNSEALRYGHMMSWPRCFVLGAGALGLIMVQVVMFCLMEWRNQELMELSTYQKLAGSLFQVTNSRHSGENIVDFFSLSSAILVLFVVVMYLPASTILIPTATKPEMETTGNVISSNKNLKKNTMMIMLRNLKVSPVFNMAIFIIVICITERQSMKQDPLNFNVFNIILEVASAYGNVGYTMGYSCSKRRLMMISDDGKCEDKWYGFVGWWSKEGKVLLILVMLFGRLNKLR
ncbi:Sodium transporter HKT1-like protein [Drosera capensis]